MAARQFITSHREQMGQDRERLVMSFVQTAEGSSLRAQAVTALII